MRVLKMFTLVPALLLVHLSSNAEQLLYQYNQWSINDSKYGPIALFQSQLKQKLKECGSSQTLTPDGAFGAGTKKAIIAVTECPDIKEGLADNSLAKQGAITDTLWRLIVKDQAAPDVSKRAAALKLTFEATDYDKMQWNFCQNRPIYDPANGSDVCFSNDRASYITWGPHGATAGHGEEVQAILKLYLQGGDARKDIVKNAFGSEFVALERLLTLPKEATGKKDGPVEVYLCSIWMDNNRREAWRQGFKELGKQADLHETYRTLYAASNFDGGKVKVLFDIWKKAPFALPVTELDLAFFIDRSAHMGISRKALETSLTSLKKQYDGTWPPSPAVIRRHVSNTVVPSNRKEDRLGRDVAYYIGAIAYEDLSAKEQNAWNKRGKRDAVDAGLSDERMISEYEPSASIKFQPVTGQLNSDETCPTEVLNPHRPR
jgi:hypothetical protein